MLREDQVILCHYPDLGGLRDTTEKFSENISKTESDETSEVKMKSPDDVLDTGRVGGGG